MKESVRLDEQGGQEDGCIQRGLACPNCRYCLRGLPMTGRCPECGLAYIAEYPNEKRAIELFAQEIPSLLRCGIAPRYAVRHPIMAVAAVFLVACVSSALVVGALCLGTKLGFAFATPVYPPIRGVVADVGMYGTHGALVRWQVRRICFYGELLFFGQLLVSFSVWFVYAARSRSIGLGGRAIRRLGLLAACGSAPVLLVPGLIASLWQVPNASGILSRPVVSIPRFFLFRSRWRFDSLQVFGAVLLVVLIVWMTIWMVSRHSVCSRKLRQAMLGVRSALGTDEKTR